MNINKTMQLPETTGYYKDVIAKKQIVLHHTVGGSAKSTFNYWVQQANHVATAYIVERDGTIYEVFDPKYWAHHLGLKLLQNKNANMKSIGIELASEGPLRSGNELNILSKTNNFDAEYLYAFDVDVPPFSRAKKLYHMFNDKDKFFHWGLKWRGYNFFDLYDEPQMAATMDLVNFLCGNFHIPKQLIPNKDKLEFDISTLNFNGIITHCNIRADKSDLSPACDWDRIQKSLI